jgi:hypothetical protein
MKLYKIPLSFVELRSHEEHNFLFVMLFDNKKVSIVEDTIHLSSNIPTTGFLLGGFISKNGIH